MSVLNQRVFSGWNFADFIFNQRIKLAEEAWYMGKSDVAGQGVFAGIDYDEGDVVGVAMTRGGEDDYGADLLDLTTLARYCNHQNDNNVKVVKSRADEVFHLVTTRPVEQDEEFYADYRQVARAIGPHSRMLWEGKDVPTSDLADYFEKESATIRKNRLVQKTADSKKVDFFHSCCGKPAGECDGCSGHMTLVTKDELNS